MCEGDDRVVADDESLYRILKHQDMQTLALQCLEQVPERQRKRINPSLTDGGASPIWTSIDLGPFRLGQWSRDPLHSINSPLE